MEDNDTFLECEVCMLSFTGVEPFKQHIHGKAHKKREKMAALRKMQEVSADEDDDDDVVPGADDEQFSCRECSKAFTGAVSYLQHLKSGPHYRQLKRDKLIEKMKEEGLEHIDSSKSGTPVHPILSPPFATCAPCKKEFYCPESYQQHLDSHKHRRQLVMEDILVALKEGTGKDDLGPVETYFRNLEDDELLRALQENLAARDSTSDDPYCCKDCEKSFSGHIPFIQHFLSPAHKKQLKKLQMMKKLEEDGRREENQSSDSDVDSVLTCDLCGVAFSGVESLLVHQASKKLEMIKIKEKLRNLSVSFVDHLEKRKGKPAADRKGSIEHPTPRDIQGIIRLQEPKTAEQMEEPVKSSEATETPEAAASFNAVNQMKELVKSSEATETPEAAASSNAANQMKEPVKSNEATTSGDSATHGTPKPITREEGIQTDSKSSTIKTTKNAMKAGMKEL